MFTIKYIIVVLSTVIFFSLALYRVSSCHFILVKNIKDRKIKTHGTVVTFLHPLNAFNQMPNFMQFYSCTYVAHIKVLYLSLYVDKL